MPAPPPVLLKELLEEVFFRLPPDEPENLVRASSVCKPWRGILADAGFRRRYRELHGTPPVLGFSQNIRRDCRFLPASAFRPAGSDFCSWVAMDCRHGRVLFRANSLDIKARFEFVVWDPMTGVERRVPLPDMNLISFAATVPCAAEGCDHHGCQGQGGPFRLAVISTTRTRVTKATSACLYSSETGLWSELTTVDNLDASGQNPSMTSIIVDNVLYFNIIGNHIVKYQLATLDLSLFKKPIRCGGELITMEDGGLGFACLNCKTLTLWSRETSPDGAVGWSKQREINLVMLLPDGARSTATSSSRLYITREYGFLSGTQVIFVGTHVGVYMIDIKSGRAKKLLEKLEVGRVFPYASFCIPAMEAASTGQGQ